jgi:hypothetical protein
VRYYKIQIDGAPGSFIRTPDQSIWSSHPWGDTRNDPEAQDIEMDLDIFNAEPNGPESELSVVTVMGVSWQQIKDTNGLIDKLIVINGGMMPGFPLATFQARKRGHLLTGNIQKAWGNWVGPDMSIGMAISVRAESGDDSGGGNGEGGGGGGGEGGGGNGGGSAGGESLQFVHDMNTSRYRRGNRTGFRSINGRNFARGPSVNPALSGFDFSGFGVDFGASSAMKGFIGGGLEGLSRPLNVIHNLMPNMPLSSAINETLSKAFPGLPINMGISSLMKMGYQDAGMYQNLQQYASYIQQLSHSILGTKNYQGVHMTSDGRSIDVWDGTQSMGHEDLDPYDLIGQPTWVDRYKVNIKLVMRGGLRPGMTVSLPPGIPMTILPAAIQIGTSDQRRNVSLPGDFYINKVRHLGAYRNPDGNNWATILETTYIGGGGFDADGNPVEDAQNADNVNQQQNPQDNPPPTSENPIPPQGPPGPPTLQSFGSVVRRRPRIL